MNMHRIVFKLQAAQDRVKKNNAGLRARPIRYVGVEDAGDTAGWCGRKRNGASTVRRISRKKDRNPAYCPDGWPYHYRVTGIALIPRVPRSPPTGTTSGDMRKRYEERSLIGFQSDFPNDEACAGHPVKFRWPDGFVCPKCNHREDWYLPKGLYDCKACRFQTSITSGTIFHKTRVPLLRWYWLIYHMAMAKVGVSVFEMQRIPEIGCYETAWLMAHKIRKAMAERDAMYSLAGLVEMDESFFGPAGELPGQGSENKCVVLCAVSLYRDKKGEEKPGFAHMRVVDDASANTIGIFLDRLGCGCNTEEGKQLLFRTGSRPRPREWLGAK